VQKACFVDVLWYFGTATILDKIQTIKELLCVKYGLISLPLFDVSQVDFVLESLYSLLIFYVFCAILQ